MPVEALPFSFHPGVFQILGEELVSDPIIALAELVKNSYDADAEHVRIELVSQPERMITVSDDGHGMTRHDVSDGWLVVGTPLKREPEKPRSRNKGRVLVGSMGIGRLAAFSIADTVEVTTVAGDGYSRHFSIRLSEITDLESLSNLKVDVSTERKPDAPTGTVIRLTEVKQWLDEEQIVALKRRLGALLGPEESEDFNIHLVIDGEDEPLALEEVLPEAPITVEALVSEDGVATVSLNATKELFLGDARIPKGGWEFTSDLRYDKLPGVKIKAFWYPLGDRPARQYWKLVGQDVISEAAGVRVYRDGIRVLPYGEPGDDWLELERTYVKAGAVQRHPRPSSVVGWVVSWREKNPGLKDTANREGLKNTPAFGQLRRFGKEVFQRVAEVRRILEPVVPRGREPRLEDIAAVRESLRAIAEVLPDEAEVLDHFAFLERVTDAYQAQSELTSLYRDRLTAGNLVDVVMHDVGVALKPTAKLLTSAREEECEIDSHTLMLESMADLVPRILGAYDLLRGAARAGAYRVSNVKVWKTVLALIERVNLIEVSRETHIDPDCQEIVARMREADLWSIVVNLVLNAVSSSDFAHARDRKFPPQRVVQLRVFAEELDLVIECEDNGPGLPNKPEGWIWAPFNSTKEKGGSGLGLFIVSDAATWYRGTCSATQSEAFDSGAKFRVVLPEVVVSVAG